MNPSYLINMVTDNYLKKELYELIKSDEYIFDFIQMSSFDGLWYRDLEKPENEWMNARFWTTLGYNPDEMPHLSSTWQNIINQDDLNVALGNFEKHLNNPNHPYDQIVRYKHKNGSTVWIHCRGLAIREKNGKPIRMLGAHHDITELKIKEAELIKAKEKAEQEEMNYKTLFEANTDGITIFRLVREDLPPVIIDMNENSYKMLGYSKDEMLELNPVDLETCLTKEKLDKRIYELKTKGATNFETTVRHKNGYDVYVEIKALMISYNNQSALMNIVRDISERKLAEKEIVHAKEKAEENDSLKTAFLNNISHEVRTPLNAIVGFADLMTGPVQAPEVYTEYSQMISEGSEKLIEIITDIIEISEIATNQIQAKFNEFDLILLINKLGVQFSRKAKENSIGFLLNLNIRYDEYFIKSDIGKLKQILFHLLDNAIKFTPVGSVSITCEMVKDNFQVAISDSGIGIADEMKEVIFEPFRQVETGLSRKFGGNGLGLSIVKAYVKLLKGSISLKSEIGKGTTVSVSIPVNKVRKPLSPKLNPEANYPIATILIAEDDFGNFKYMCDLLDGTSLTILHATNGRQALEMCQKNRAIDLVLMDLEMPVMDGHTATKLIKEFRSDLTVIAQTAYALDSEKQKYEDVFDDYITKPIRGVDLKQKLAQFITIEN